MKADIHPDYHFIDVKMTDGTVYKTRTTWGKEGDSMTLEVDPTSHPAWKDGASGRVVEKGQLKKFKDRFGAFGLPSDDNE